MSLRENFKLYRKTVWTGTPTGEYRLTGPAPPNRFAIVTAACPRGRPKPVRSADDAANEALAGAIRRAGFEPHACVGSDPDPASPHAEASFWVEGVDPRTAIAWGRQFEQHAVVVGDGRRHGMLPCFPESEPPDPPASLLLLHGRGGSGQGSVALLDRALRSRGWDSTRVHCPTINAIRDWHVDLEILARDAAAELEACLRGLDAYPTLIVGLSAGGALAMASAAPWRIAVGTPWSLVPSQERTRFAEWPGGTAIHGANDATATVERDLAVLPAGIHRVVEPDATHEFDDWMDRLADRVIQLWSTPIPVP